MAGTANRTILDGDTNADMDASRACSPMRVNCKDVPIMLGRNALLALATVEIVKYDAVGNAASLSERGMLNWDRSNVSRRSDAAYIDRNNKGK